MKKTRLILALLLALAAVGCAAKEEIILPAEPIYLLEHSEIDPSEIAIYRRTKAGEERITDFALAEAVAENMEALTVTVGENTYAVPVVLCRPQTYQISYPETLYDSVKVAPEKVRLTGVYDDAHSWPVTVKEGTAVTVRSDDPQCHLVKFTDAFGTHELALEKAPAEKLICMDTVCPYEAPAQQELHFFVKYQDGRMEKADPQKVEIQTETRLPPGEQTLTAVYRGEEMEVSVYVAGEELHPIKMEAPAEKGTIPTSRADAGGICFIGDSRLCGLQASVESNAMFFYRTAASLYWLQGEGAGRLSVVSDDVHTVVILMGLNDLYHPTAYADYMNEWSAQYPEKRFIFLSLGPVNEEVERTHGYKVKNSEVEFFNETVKAGLSSGVEFMDIYGFLQKEGFSTTDGVHYLQNDYVKIYNYVMENL